jgi:hypothetical protein
MYIKKNGPPPALAQLDPKKSRRIGRYLRSNPHGPSQSEKDCLIAFFDELRKGSVQNRYRMITDEIYQVFACNHVIEMFINHTTGDSKVSDIYRGQF